MKIYEEENKEIEVRECKKLTWFGLRYLNP